MEAPQFLATSPFFSPSFQDLFSKTYAPYPKISNTRIFVNMLVVGWFMHMTGRDPVPALIVSGVGWYLARKIIVYFTTPSNKQKLEQQNTINQKQAQIIKQQTQTITQLQTKLKKFEGLSEAIALGLADKETQIYQKVKSHEENVQKTSSLHQRIQSNALEIRSIVSDLDKHKEEVKEKAKDTKPKWSPFDDSLKACASALELFGTSKDAGTQVPDSMAARAQRRETRDGLTQQFAKLTQWVDQKEKSLKKISRSTRGLDSELNEHCIKQNSLFQEIQALWTEHTLFTRIWNHLKSEEPKKGGADSPPMKSPVSMEQRT